MVGHGCRHRLDAGHQAGDFGRGLIVAIFFSNPRAKPRRGATYIQARGETPGMGSNIHFSECTHHKGGSGWAFRYESTGFITLRAFTLSVMLHFGSVSFCLAAWIKPGFFSGYVSSPLGSIYRL